MAAISRLLLCEDYLARPVTFSRTSGLSDDSTSSALTTEPGCMGCHSSIEPIAATLFGFWNAIQYNPHEMDTYHPEREPMGPELLGVEPSYFGTPIAGLADLGGQIAADHRFHRCTAETAAETMWRRPVDVWDFDTIEALRADFVAAELRYLPLLSAVTDTPEYRVGTATGGTEEEREAVMTRRMMTPDQYASVVEDLTGYRWNDAGFDLLRSDEYGFRVLAGGVDGAVVTSPQQEPGLTWGLVQKRTAQAAADYVVEQDLVGGTDPRLLTEVDLDSRPGDAAFTSQLEALDWRLLGSRADADRFASLEALWTDAEAASDPAAAWKVVVTVLLRDPAFVVY